MKTKAFLVLGISTMILSGCTGPDINDDDNKTPSACSRKMGDLQDLRSSAEKRLDSTSGLRNTLDNRMSARNISLGQVIKY